MKDKPMSMTDNLIEALKQQMKVKNLTYRDAARRLEVSEATVKRLFSEQNFTLQRLEKLCDLTEISLTDLMAAAENQIETTDQLTFEQEKAIITNPKLLLVGVCLVNHYSFDDILNKYTMEEPELIGLFTQLDKLGIIELLPENKYRLRLSPDFQWQPNGPIQKFFIESLVTEYMVGEMQSSDNHLHFVWGMLSAEAGLELQQKIRRMIDDYVHLTASRRAAPVEKHNSSLLVLFKENWEPSMFKEKWQQKHGVK